MRTCRRCRFKLFQLLCLIISTFIIALVNDGFLIDIHSFSSIPFWQDNRTFQTGRSSPLPIIAVDEVNLTNLTLVITACCRNVEKHLIGFQKNVRAIGALFRNYRLFLLESDSNDGTLKFLEEWARNDSNHVYVHTSGQQRWRLFFRTQRLAFCRNFLLERARADVPLFDFYLVLDVDVTSSTTFTTDNFVSNFIYPSSSWAVMTATQTDRYYDIWALRTWPTMTFDFLQRARQLSSISIAWPWITERLISIHQKPIPRDHPLIEVESAFGGAGIYAARYLSNECVYDGWINHGWWWYREQCEHVAFNQCVRRKAGGGKLFINPQFQNI